MDRHAAGPLDGLWAAVAAGAGSSALTSKLDSTQTGMAGSKTNVSTSPARILLWHTCCLIRVHFAPVAWLVGSSGSKGRLLSIDQHSGRHTDRYGRLPSSPSSPRMQAFLTDACVYTAVLTLLLQAVTIWQSDKVEQAILLI